MIESSISARDAVGGRSGHRAVFAPIPRAVILDRGPVLVRSLRGLSDALLSTMAVALERHADELVPGQLYVSRDHGGCAVGVTLRELFPDHHDCGRLAFFWHYGRRKGLTKAQVRRFPRLRHLQWIFDESVGGMRVYRPDLTIRDASRSVGLWFRAEARNELARRRARANTHAFGRHRQIHRSGAADMAARDERIAAFLAAVERSARGRSASWSG